MMNSIDSIQRKASEEIAKNIDTAVFYTMCRGLFRVYQQQLKGWWFITPSRRRKINDAMNYADEYMEGNYNQYKKYLGESAAPDEE